MSTATATIQSAAAILIAICRRKCRLRLKFHYANAARWSSAASGTFEALC
jgi:hypothetical protein